jgi:4-amino-4-deoxychorismate lyase
MDDAGVPFDDRGLAYGDGLFETVLVRDGRALLWEAHLARLRRGCQRLGIPSPAVDDLNGLPARAGPGLKVLKLIVTRGSGGRGYRLPDQAVPRLRWRTAPFAPDERRWQAGVGVRLCELRLGIQPRLAGLKHLNRLENLLARGEWQDEQIAEGLLCDSEGYLVEATSMNLFWYLDGQWQTPRLDRCGVAGTLRQRLLDSVPMSEVRCGTEVLARIEAPCLGNSVQGLWPVTGLEDAAGRVLHRWPLGARQRELQEAAHELLGYPRLN